MIELGTLTSALCAYIQIKTGIFAIDERLRTTVYPSVYAEASETETSLACGGSQLFRKISVTLELAHSRERDKDGQRELCHAVYGAILPWFPCEGRKFCPLGLSFDGANGRIAFDLTFYDVLPQNHSPLLSPMGTLKLSLGATALGE